MTSISLPKVRPPAERMGHRYVFAIHDIRLKRTPEYASDAVVSRPA